MNPPAGNLAEVRRATARRTSAEQGWRDSIKRAHDAGLSLREIARAAGVTHPRVLQILRGQ